MPGITDSHIHPSLDPRNVKQTNVQFEQNVGAEYGEHIKNVTAMVNTSSTHTYGNVMSVIRKWLLDKFPPDTFKSVVMGTAIASRQLRHRPHQLQKHEMPTMVLVPRIVFGQDENRFAGRTLMNERMTNTHALWGFGNLIQLAHDRKRDLWVHGRYNRAVMYVDVVMSFTTLTEQMNWMSYIFNMHPIGHPQFIKAPLELYLPKDFCHMLGNLAGIPPYREDDQTVGDFLSYMNSFWCNPVTYKMKGSSGGDAFFMYYVTDIDTVVDPPQAHDPVKDGQSKRNFNISFTIRCDFNTVSYLTINSPQIRNPIQIRNVDEDTIIPIFTDNIDLSNFELPIGWSVYEYPIFKLDIGEDSIGFRELLNTSLNVMIDHHLLNGVPIERFLLIQFRENGKIINEPFHIDWKNRRLILANPDHQRTYRLLITTSHEYVNALIAEIYDLE